VCFHLVEGCVRWCNAVAGQALFDCVETPRELLIGVAKTGFGIEAKLSCKIGNDEQDVAEFIGQYPPGEGRLGVSLLSP